MPLLGRGTGHSPRSAWERVVALGRKARSSITARWPTLSLLMLPHILGQLKTVATAAEVDAMRGLSCADYYYRNPGELHALGHKHLDTLSCQRPEVEAYFSTLTIRIVISTALVNFVGMLVYGHLFQPRARRWMAMTGMLGNAIARIPILFLPLYQYPYLAPASVFSITPDTMVKIYWVCMLICGLSGSSDLVTLCVESVIVDTASPQHRSRLFSMVQVSLLLGASLGPILGGLTTYLFPQAANRCTGYRKCMDNYRPKRNAPNLLFNTAPYWLAVAFCVFGMVWVYFCFRGDPPEAQAEETRCAGSCACRPAPQSRREKRSWLGPFRLLVPIRHSRWTWDCRILQFTLSEALNRLSIEGIVVLIYILGYVFNWGQNLLAIGLSVSNTLNMLVVTVLLPVITRYVRRVQQKPRSTAALSDEQLQTCMNMTSCDLASETRPGIRRRRSVSSLDAPPGVSPKSCLVVRFWRAQVDLNVARAAFLSNMVSWLTMALGVAFRLQWLVLLGAAALAFGTVIDPMLRSAACTVADTIAAEQERKKQSLPEHNAPPQAAGDEAAEPVSGADSYLVIVTTVLLPILITGPILRNWVYGETIDTFPGAFFLVVAGFQCAALVLLSTTYRPYSADD